MNKTDTNPSSRESLNFVLSLLHGEEVKCASCGQGTYKGITTPTEKCFCFICHKCGDKVNIN